jgi:hypothetical protein
MLRTGTLYTPSIWRTPTDMQFRLYSATVRSQKYFTLSSSLLKAKTPFTLLDNLDFHYGARCKTNTWLQRQVSFGNTLNTCPWMCVPDSSGDYRRLTTGSVFTSLTCLRTCKRLSKHLDDDLPTVRTVCRAHWGVNDHKSLARFGHRTNFFCQIHSKYTFTHMLGIYESTIDIKMIVYVVINTNLYISFIY